MKLTRHSDLNDNWVIFLLSALLFSVVFHSLPILQPIHIYIYIYFTKPHFGKDVGS